MSPFSFFPLPFGGPFGGSSIISSVIGRVSPAPSAAERARPRWWVREPPYLFPALDETRNAKADRLRASHFVSPAGAKHD